MALPHRPYLPVLRVPAAPSLSPSFHPRALLLECFLFPRAPLLSKMNRELSPTDTDVRTRLLTECSASETRDASARSSLELQTLPPSAQHDMHTPTATGLPEALQVAAEARKVADEALKAVILLKVSLQEEKSRAKKEESKLEAREKEQRSRWFP
jgi:hypothetical protein